MSASNAFETDLLELIFNGTAIPNLADDAASSPATNLYVSLHTADPGETGAQNTSETAYGSYARVAVARTSGGWTISGNNASNTAVINFPAASSGPSTVTHFAIGLSSSGAGTLLFTGALAASRIINTGITPTFAAGELDCPCD